MSRAPKFLAAVGVTALLVGACSNAAETIEPKKDLRDAAVKFSDSQTVSMTISIDGKPEAFAAMSDETELSDDDKKIMEQLTNSSLTIKADVGKDREDPSDDIVYVGAKVDGLDAGEMVMANEVVYLKVAFDEIGEKYETIQPDLESMREGIESDDQFASLVPLLDGEWVQIDSATTDSLFEAGGASPATTVEDMEAVKAAMEDILNDATIVRDKKDDNKINVTANMREAYTTLLPVLESLGASSAASLTGESLPGVEEAPDKDLSMDFWVNDGNLEKMELDLGQFSETADGPVVLRVEISDDVDIDVPEGAEIADLSTLFGSMGMGI